jgi:HSP20 family molecular chaperone IbpA
MLKQWELSGKGISCSPFLTPIPEYTNLEIKHKLFTIWLDLCGYKQEFIHVALNNGRFTVSIEKKKM